MAYPLLNWYPFSPADISGEEILSTYHAPDVGTGFRMWHLDLLAGFLSSRFLDFFTLLDGSLGVEPFAFLAAYFNAAHLVGTWVDELLSEKTRTAHLVLVAALHSASIAPGSVMSVGIRASEGGEEESAGEDRADHGDGM